MSPARRLTAERYQFLMCAGYLPVQARGSNLLVTAAVLAARERCRAARRTSYIIPEKSIEWV